MNSSILFGISLTLFVIYWIYAAVKQNKQKKAFEQKHAEVMREMKRMRYKLEGIRKRNP